MKKSLLFIPDISGFTKFIQNTEAAHSQHVIAELLEVLIAANTQDLVLAEIEGDALFFYKEESIPSQEKLLAQIESMFTAFYSHLSLLEKNRICPCNACATAPELQLKIVAHCGDLQFITVQGKRKPFGTQVIEAHRLLKNSVNSDNYALISRELSNEIGLQDFYQSKVFKFKPGSDSYDDKEVPYVYSILDKTDLKLLTFPRPEKLNLLDQADIVMEREFSISAKELLEYITNYSYRHHWVEGVDKFEYNEDEVTRIGSEHVCVINGKHLNFETVTKDSEFGQYVYGEKTSDVPVIDHGIQFYIISPVSELKSKLRVEFYLHVKSTFKKIIAKTLLKRVFKKNIKDAINGLENFVNKTRASNASLVG